MHERHRRDEEVSWPGWYGTMEPFSAAGSWLDGFDVVGFDLSGKRWSA